MALVYSGTSPFWTPWESFGQSPSVLIREKCPYFRGSLYTSIHSWDSGTVLIREVASFQR